MNKLHLNGILKSVFVINTYKLSVLARRTMLSEAYSCEEAWKKRLEQPVLKNIKMDQYFIETDKKFGTKHLVSGIDLDLFANGVEEESQLDELEHLLYRFRKTKRAPEIMDSTTYAVIRVFLKFKQYESLFRILDDRDSYGIFPDFYSYNILMSSFLKEKMYKEAAKVAILMMQQEDFENKISCLLGLHSCQTFLDECSLDLLKEEEEEVVEEKKANDDDDEEEETLVRVPFLRNPWFDDHFEITNPKHLIGKTFYLIGRELNDSLGRSYQLVGLAMYEKWEKAAGLLKSFADSEDADVLNDTFERVKLQIDTIPDDDQNTREKCLEEFTKYFEVLKSKGKILDTNCSTVLADSLKDVAKLEEQDIAAQKNMFLQWEKDRKFAFDKQSVELDKERRLKIIEEKKEYLYWKEKLLFFFEHEDKNLKDLAEVEEMVAQIKAKDSIKESYFPPEITKKAPITISKYQRLARVKRIF